MDIYYKTVSYTIIGNTQKKLIQFYDVVGITHFTAFYNETTCGFKGIRESLKQNYSLLFRNK